MPPAPTLRITNYSFAIGRIGLAILFIPLLTGVGGEMIFYAIEQVGLNTGDRYSSATSGVLLLLFNLPFLWLGLTTPTSIQVDELITVNYMCRTRKYSLEDVLGVYESTEGTGIFTPESAVSSLASGNTFLSGREYRVCILQLRKGRQVKFGVSTEQKRNLIARLLCAKTSSDRFDPHGRASAAELSTVRYMCEV